MYQGLDFATVKQLARTFLSFFAIFTIPVVVIEDRLFADDPVVARIQMRLAVGEETIDEIEIGDLLTVLEDRGDKYVIQTPNGKKGIVAKLNVALLPESVDIYSRLIEKETKDGRLYTLRGSAYWAANDRDRALADFDRAIELGYDSAHAFSSRGLFHLATGDFEKAIDDFSTVIDKGKADDVVYINRAAAFVRLGKFAEAIRDYDKLIEAHPESAPLYEQRAIAYRMTDQFDRAIADFSKAIELDDKMLPAWMGRGFVYFLQKKHEQAVKDFSAVIERNPQAAVAYNNRGYNYQRLGKFAEASADYRTALQLAPTYELAYQNQAWLLATCDDPKIRDPKQAIESASKACELSDFKNPSNLAALAAAFAADGQFDKAVGWQEKVVEASDETQREWANKLLDRYRSNLPFDPKLAEELSSLP